jgi:hypothetical protein
VKTTYDLTASALSSAYRGKELSPVEVAHAALARIEAWENKINAMYVIDAAGTLAQAAASEARWRVGAPLSALDGVPITIKDNIAVRGIPTPVGTAAGDVTPAGADAPPAARVREAGCIILGKTIMSRCQPLSRLGPFYPRCEPPTPQESPNLRPHAVTTLVNRQCEDSVDLVPQYRFWTGVDRWGMKAKSSLILAGTAVWHVVPAPKGFLRQGPFQVMIWVYHRGSIVIVIITRQPPWSGHV